MSFVDSALRMSSNYGIRNIIPEFFYKEIYGDKYEFMVFSDQHARPVLAPQQKGSREHLLCQACETHFNKWETYAARILRGPRSAYMTILVITPNTRASPMTSLNSSRNYPYYGACPSR